MVCTYIKTHQVVHFMECQLHFNKALNKSICCFHSVTKCSKAHLFKWQPHPYPRPFLYSPGTTCVIETDEKWDRSLVGFVSSLPHPSLPSPFQSFLLPLLFSSHLSPKSPECERLHLFLQKLFCSAIKHSSPYLPRKLETCVITGIMDGTQSPGPGVQRLHTHPCGQEDAAFWRTMWGCCSPPWASSELRAAATL